MIAQYVAGYQCDHIFDWTIIKYQQLHAGSAPPRNLVCGSRRSILKILFMSPICYVNGIDYEIGEDFCRSNKNVQLVEEQVLQLLPIHLTLHLHPNQV